MPLSQDAIRRRAVKSGVKASKKRHHLVSTDELLAMRIQVMPAMPRISMAAAGLLLIASCWSAWPFDNLPVQVIEAVVGVFLLLFGIFGIRRTLSEVFDAGSSELLGGILEAIGDAVSNIDL